MKTLTKIRVGFVSAAAALMCFSSCSTDDNMAGGSGAASMQEGVVLLSINTGQMGTRALDGTTDLNTNEKKIENMTIGIFDATGTLKTVKTFEGAGTGDVQADGKIYPEGEVSKVKMISSKLKTGDKVVVAVNTSDASKTTLLAAKNLTEFNKASRDSKDILPLASAGTLPKYGTAALVDDAVNSQYKADVTVKNLVSRVTLSALDVQLEGAYRDATFTLENVYLTHVPSAVDYSENGWTAKTFTSTNDKYVHGILSKADGCREQDAYLKLPLTQATVGLDKFLYATPNQAVDTDKTTLVLAGKFNMGGTQQDIYYPLALNAHYNAATGKMEAADPQLDMFKTRYGMNYKCSVIIKTIGTDDPWELVTPQTATITVTVDKWQNVTQSTIFQ